MLNSRQREYEKKSNYELRAIIQNNVVALRTGITGINASNAVSDKIQIASEILQERGVSMFFVAQKPWNFQ